MLRETSDMINENLSTDSVLDGRAFKVKVNILADQLDHKCQEFDLILNDKEYINSIPEDVQGNIQAAIGQSRLLLSKKINQFRQLCDDNIVGPSSADDRLTTNEDLAGFWDMLEIQIEQCRSAFSELDNLRQSNWTDVTSSKLNPESVSSNVQPAIYDKSSSNKRKISSTYRSSESTKKPPPSGRSAELRELIRQRRMQMKTNGHENNVVNDNIINNATSSNANCSDNVSCQSTNNYRQANNDIIM
ncbi:hypothetical protein GJ496_008637 [Pomphorhynchus laevis]|nr:hypothetical protein GJ496_008637 [Pomphorhynchus laevis]